MTDIIITDHEAENRGTAFLAVATLTGDPEHIPDWEDVSLHPDLKSASDAAGRHPDGGYVAAIFGDGSIAWNWGADRWADSPAEAVEAWAAENPGDMDDDLPAD